MKSRCVGGGCVPDQTEELTALPQIPPHSQSHRPHSSVLWASGLNLSDFHCFTLDDLDDYLMHYSLSDTERPGCLDILAPPLQLHICA